MQRTRITRVLVWIGLILLAIAIVLAAAFWYSRSWENALFISPLHTLPGEEPYVALTFDDGPSPTRTPLLLDLLDEKDVKATFFMLGQNIERHPDIARDVYARGHLIGNHSYDHPRLYLKTPRFVRDQVERTDSLIEGLFEPGGQQEVRYFRPPGSGKFIVLPLVLASMDKVLVTGTYDPPAEYVSPFDAERVADQVVENSTPGAIVYLHDGHSRDAEAFVRSVDMIITRLRSEGYEFVTLDREH